MYGVKHHHIAIIVALVVAGVVLWFLIFSQPAL